MKTLGYEEQLDELLKLGLRVHPLDKDNCWEIYGLNSSTDKEAEEKWKQIKQSFPQARIFGIKNNSLLVDLYKELCYETNISYKDTINFIKENVDIINFGVECTCTYGNTYIERIKGTSYKFVMWRSIIITDSNVLSINPGPRDPIENKVLEELFEKLDTEFFHVGSDEYDNVREFYNIKGILKKEFL